MAFAAAPMAVGPVAAVVLVLRRRTGTRPSRATRRFTEELRAVADILPRLRPLAVPAPPAGSPAHSCPPNVPAPRRPHAREQTCELCAR
jgi:hypothetical protein